MFFKKKKPIGLDIGSSYIKLVQLSETKAGYELVAFDMVPLPFDTIGEGIINERDNLATAIKELLTKSGVKAENAILSVSGHSAVIIKKITLPSMTAEELGTSIKYEAEQYIPFDINDVNIDFQILGSRPGEEGQMEVILVAVKKEVISGYVDAVDLAGLNTIIVDVDSFALGNMYEINYGFEEKKDIALINIGASKTNINILQGGMPVFTRDSSIGSNYQTEALERDLNVSKEDAERLKKGQSVEGISPEDVQISINSASDEIYTDIYRSFEYYRSSVSEEEISGIILSGGTALMKGFPEILAQRLGMPVEIANPFQKISINEKLDVAHIRDVAPIAAVAVGLALRGFEDKK